MNAKRKNKKDDKDKKKKDKDKKKEEAEGEIDPKDDQNRIAISPTFDKLKSFFVSAFKKIIVSTN